MKKASEYRAHADECRQLAAAMDLCEHRDQLLEMALNWDKLARERSELVARHPELGVASQSAQDAA
jgi:hypothetical protein